MRLIEYETSRTVICQFKGAQRENDVQVGTLQLLLNRFLLNNHCHPRVNIHRYPEAINFLKEQPIPGNQRMPVPSVLSVLFFSFLIFFFILLFKVCSRGGGMRQTPTVGVFFLIEHIESNHEESSKENALQEVNNNNSSNKS